MKSGTESFWLKSIETSPPADITPILRLTGGGGGINTSTPWVFYSNFFYFSAHNFLAASAAFLALARLSAICLFISSGSTWVCQSATAGPWISIFGSPFSYTKADSAAVSFGFSGITSSTTS